MKDKIKGRVWKFGDDIDTDIIIPGRYLVLTDENELAKHAMEGLDPEFYSKTKEGDIILAGKNFGCGSSREHAPIALKAAGISAVVAESFARIFSYAYQVLAPSVTAASYCIFRKRLDARSFYHMVLLASLFESTRLGLHALASRLTCGYNIICFCCIPISTSDVETRTCCKIPLW